MHLADCINEAPILSPTDVAAITQWGVANNIEFLSLSFARTAEDVQEVRALMNK